MKVTAQQIFDTVVTHLRTQGCKSQAPLIIEVDPACGDYECRYRALKDNGEVLKCAVGCLIDDHEYDPAMEGHGVMTLFSSYPAIKYRLDMFQGLLLALQRCHDFNNPEAWEKQLSFIAKNHSLNYTSL